MCFPWTEEELGVLGNNFEQCNKTRLWLLRLEVFDIQDVQIMKALFQVSLQASNEQVTILQ